MAHVDEALLNLTLAFFPMVTRDELRSSELITLPNVGLAKGFKVSPFQLFGVVWMFARERLGVCPGGMNADEAGSGKTVEMLLLYLLNYLHYQNVEFVEAYWKKLDKGCQNQKVAGAATCIRDEDLPHLPKDAAPGSKCLSAKQQPMACYCKPDNRKNLYRKPLQPGIRLNLTPAAGLRSFHGDATKMFEGGEIMRRTVPPRIAIEFNAFDRLRPFGGLSNNEVASFSKKADWSERIAWEQKEKNCLQRVNNRMDQGH